jgi:hypothetical protein
MLKNGLTAGQQSPDAKAKLTLRRGPGGSPVKSAKKKRGRPSKPKGERRSKNRTFRVHGLMDEYLIGHADLSGRSVSEEIEARLERSFYMDAVMFTYADVAQPLLSAIATGTAYSFLTGAVGLDRYRVLQAATGYIIAAFGSRNTTARTRTKVSDARWPPPGGTPEGHELEGMQIAYLVLNNLDPEGLAEQKKDLAEILKSDVPTPLAILRRGKS